MGAESGNDEWSGFHATEKILAPNTKKKERYARKRKQCDIFMGKKSEGHTQLGWQGKFLEKIGVKKSRAYFSDA